MGLTTCFFIEIWRKLSQNYHQMLLLNNSYDVVDLVSNTITDVSFLFSIKPTQKKKTNKRPTGHGAHLSDIATADMQMLCNIFPILSL